MIRHFLELDQIAPPVLRAIVDQAKQVKARPGDFRRLRGETLALIFEKPSTRTRVSFEVGIRELGGEAVVLTGAGDKAFCAGMDLREFAAGGARRVFREKSGFAGITQRDFPKPLIAAVNAHADKLNARMFSSFDYVVIARR